MRALGPFLKDAWRLARPYFVSEERWSARLLLLSVVVLSLSLVGMSVVLNFWNKAFYNALQDKDWDSFIALLFWYKRGEGGGIMPGFCEIVAVYILVAVYRSYLTQWLQIRWRRWMTSRFLDQWLADRAYYRIGLTAADAPGADNRTGTDNPDQRIAEDLRDFIGDGILRTRGILSLGLELMSQIVTLFSFLTILWTLSGSVTLLGVTIPGYMVWVALLYSIFGTVVTHLVGRPLAILNFRKQRVEADFRFALVRVRENTEGVALSGGEAEEKRGLATRFDALRQNWRLLMQRTKYLNALVESYGQVASIFPLIVAAPRYFSGEVALGSLFQTADAFGQVQGALSWAVDSYSSLAVFRATVERLATFDRAISAARAAAAADLTPVAGDAWAMQGVSLGLPNGATVLKPADLVFARGQSVVVSGRSGSGKSTLFRALAGIWPFAHGTITRPETGTSLFLPQRPYIPLGTLRHAIAYPADPSALPDDAVRTALADAGLGHLAPRLDEEDNWSQRLSGGEQQRVALARALLSRPDWLFLDEATASLDPEAEIDLYATLRRCLPGTTIVSIAHRPSVAALHDRHLVFRDGRLVEAGAGLAAAQ